MGPMAVSGQSGARVCVGVIVVLISVFNVAQVSSLSQIYCSSQNTGANLLGGKRLAKTFAKLHYFR